MVVVSNKGSTVKSEKSHVCEMRNARKQDRKGVPSREVRANALREVRLREFRRNVSLAMTHEC